MFKNSRIFDKLFKRAFEVDEIREGSEVIAFIEDNKRKFFRGLRNPFYLKKKLITYEAYVFTNKTI